MKNEREILKGAVLFFLFLPLPLLQLLLMHEIECCFETLCHPSIDTKTRAHANNPFKVQQ